MSSDPPDRTITARHTAHVPPWSYFVGSAVFHYLGPAFAVLLFARVAPLGVAGLRIWSAGLVFALWRRPWRVLRRLDRDGRRTVVAWALVLAVMNSCFYLAIDRLPLGTVAAIELLPVVMLAALGSRTGRNLVALGCAVGGVYLLTDVRLAGEPLGLVFAFANAALFAAYIVIAHRAACRLPNGIDGLAAAMLVACVVVVPLGSWQALPALRDPIALGAGIGVGIASSVIPYICDQLAMARMARSTYALLVALLPATATVIGVAVLKQVPTTVEAIGVALVVVAVATHREETREAAPRLAARFSADLEAIGSSGRPIDLNVREAACHPGGAKNSSAIPSGSRKETPEP